MPDIDTIVADWGCNTCGQTEGVQNGICPRCGPAQTTPITDVAKKEAGIPLQEEEEIKETEESEETKAV